jgi:germination protein M
MRVLKVRTIKLRLERKTMKKTKVLIVLLLSLILLTVAGCRLDTGPTPPDPPVAENMDVAVYYLKSSEDEIYLVREVHQVEANEDAALTALNELIIGEPLTEEAFRVLPVDTQILGIDIDQGLATVNFSPEVLNANVGANAEVQGINSIVNTLTEFPAIEKVAFAVDGDVENAMDWWGHIGLYDQPFIRDLSMVYEPVIWVTTPVAGETISSPLQIKGNARIFEATVGFRLRDTSGNIIAEYFTTASEGAPSRGDFIGELTFTTAGVGEGQLEVYESSMQDGSDVNKVIIPVRW